MTGMVTVSMISLIILGSLMRATPPWDRMSAGTRSRAMTADAPASSAIRACGETLVSNWSRYPKHRVVSLEKTKLTCSALTTSIMTPPFNMRARPALTAKLFSPSCAPWPFVVGSSVAIVKYREF